MRHFYTNLLSTRWLSTDPDTAYGVAWSGAGDNPDPDAANNVTQPEFDLVASASAVIDQGVNMAGDVIQWDITQLVLGWIDGSTPNFGLMLTDSTTDGLFRGMRFGSREGMLYGLPGAVDGPTLRIVFDGEQPCCTAQVGAETSSLALP